MTLKVPAKTFLVGEYAVLNEENCIVISHEPFFEFGNAGAIAHPESPAGRYFAQRKLKSDESLKLQAPSATSSGGFGASSAEFLANWMSTQSSLSKDRSWWQKCLSDFKNLELAGSPSGADLVSQIHGGLIEFSPKDKSIKKLNWNFKDLSFAVFKTGVKIKTHSHLLEVQKKDLRALNDPLKSVLEAFKNENSEQLISGLNNYRESLLKLNLETETTTSCISELKKNLKVLAIKGCGALGADSFLVVTKKVDTESVLKQIQSQFTLIATEHNLSQGVLWS